MPVPNTIECPVCHAGGARTKYRLTQFSVLCCQRCSVVFLSSMLTPDEVRVLFSRLYTSGEGSVPELKTYYSYCYDDTPSNPLVQLYESWLDRIESHRRPGRLLDVGCGTGLFLSVARRRGWDPYGIDESTEATEHARNHFGLDVWIGEFSEFAVDDHHFDAITGWDIIEHARDPTPLLATMRRTLAPDGVVALATPNQRNIIDLVAKTMYRLSAGRIRGPLEKFYIEQHFIYFTPRTLSDALARADLCVVTLERELTDLRRLDLSLPMRGILELLFLAARLTGLENRIFTIARPCDASRQ